jgi:hypothetical protein
MATSKTRKSRKKATPQHEIRMRGALDRCIMRGQIVCMLGDASGKPLWDKPLIVGNSVVTSGRAWVLKHVMSSQSANVSTQIINNLAIGTGTTAPTTANTALANETARAGITTETDNSGNATPNVVWAASFDTNVGNGTLAECGVFNSSSAGTMLARATFTATFVKTTSNTLTVSHTISI